VAALFENVGRVDAIVATTGNLFFGPLEKMTSRDFAIGLQDKLLGQVRLALTGQHYLTGWRLDYANSGIVGQEPIAQGVNATTVNAALEGFVKAAACELKHGQRINVLARLC
jgi:NAD(P)-dependent dehydrogenase (short-subunit alcohol dehydrogenase family)